MLTSQINFVEEVKKLMKKLLSFVFSVGIYFKTS